MVLIPVKQTFLDTVHVSQLKDFLCPPPPVTYNFMPVQKLPRRPDFCLKMGIHKAGGVPESHRAVMAGWGQGRGWNTAKHMQAPRLPDDAIAMPTPPRLPLTEPFGSLICSSHAPGATPATLCTQKGEAAPCFPSDGSFPATLSGSGEGQEPFRA